ncbi:MAG: hypothetical protein HY718_19920, partial [Planctomycetes bacterium]|nr:hypothetical protein [Planctomycetota bacterium]
ASAQDPGTSNAATGGSDSGNDDSSVNARPSTMPADSGTVTEALVRLQRVPLPQRPQPGLKPAVAPGSAAPAARPSAVAEPAAPNGPGDATLARENGLPVNSWVPYPGPYGYGGYSYGHSRLPSSKREWVDYRYFGGQPSRYGYGRYVGAYGIGDGMAGEYFRFGFLEGYDRGRWERTSSERVESVLSHAGTHMSRGLAAFRAGQYREATKYFKLAADENQGDPAVRLYATHALFAIGRYQEGVEYLRRAFSLEPRIALLTYDLREDYGRKTDFTEQLDALDAAAKASPGNMDRLVLLGYVLNYSGQIDRAYEVLAKARKIDANDKLVKLLYEATNPPDVAK